MTITRTSRILTAIYYKLLEQGFNKENATNICVHINPEIIRVHKDKAIDILVDDVMLAYKELEAKVDKPIAFNMLLCSMNCHYEVEQPIY